MAFARNNCEYLLSASFESSELSRPDLHTLQCENVSLHQQLNDCHSHCNRLIQHASDLRCDLSNADKYKIGLIEKEHTLQIHIRDLGAIKKSYLKERMFRLIAEDNVREKEKCLERARVLILLQNVVTPERLQDLTSNDSSFHSFLGRRFATDEEKLDEETNIQRLEVILAWSEKMNDEYRAQIRKQSKELESLKVKIAELVGCGHGTGMIP